MELKDRPISINEIFNAYEKLPKDVNHLLTSSIIFTDLIMGTFNSIESVQLATPLNIGSYTIPSIEDNVDEVGEADEDEEIVFSYLEDEVLDSDEDDEDAADYEEEELLDVDDPDEIDGSEDYFDETDDSDELDGFDDTEYDEVTEIESFDEFDITSGSISASVPEIKKDANNMATPEIAIIEDTLTLVEIGKNRVALDITSEASDLELLLDYDDSYSAESDMITAELDTYWEKEPKYVFATFSKKEEVSDLKKEIVDESEFISRDVIKNTAKQLITENYTATVEFKKDSPIEETKKDIPVILTSSKQTKLSKDEIINNLVEFVSSNNSSVTLAEAEKFFTAREIRSALDAQKVYRHISNGIVSLIL